jgi:hypothetical protein
VSIRSNASSMPLSKHAARRMTPRLCCKAYTFRLYPTKKQVGKLEWTLRRCKELYNAALQERREAYRLRGVSVSGCKRISYQRSSSCERNTRTFIRRYNKMYSDASIKPCKPSSAAS